MEDGAPMSKKNATAKRGPMPEAAMILAAGLGTRMRPLTEDRPKPLIEVGGKALIDWAVDWVLAAGVKRVVVNTHYHADQLEAHLAARDWKRAGVSLDIVREEERLETGGGVRNALDKLGDGPFFVVNSDSVFINGPTHGLRALAARWDPAIMDALLLLHPTPYAIGYAGRGDFTMDQLGQLIRREESEVAPYLFSGAQILTARAFADTPEGAFSLNTVYDRALEAGRLYGLHHDGIYIHVGSPDVLDMADQILRGKHRDIG